MQWKLLKEQNLDNSMAAPSLRVNVLKNERWFSHREKDGELRLIDSLLFTSELGEALISLNLYSLAGTEENFYFIPLFITPKSRQENYLFTESGFYYYDGVPTLEYITLIYQCFQERREFHSALGQFKFHTMGEFPQLHFQLHGSSSNSLLFVSNQMLIKNYRLIFNGHNPEIELSQALTKLGSKQIPQIFGYLQFYLDSGQTFTLLLMEELLKNEGTGWKVWEKLICKLDLNNRNELLQQATDLGMTLGGFHLDLAKMSREAGCCHPVSMTTVNGKIENLQQIIRKELSEFLKDETLLIISRIHQIHRSLINTDLGQSFRIHGDLHLEQVLKTPAGWKVIDFEGEPLKSIENRGNYDSPLKDVAAMLRSISYRIYSLGISNDKDCESSLREHFLQGYLDTCHQSQENFLPGPDIICLLELFLWERVIYETIYELKYRPEWMYIPQHGIHTLLESEYKGV